MPDKILSGQTALVTGGGRGLGRAFALALAQAGASVAITARSAGELEETAALVRDAGGAALIADADIADPAQVRAMIRQVQKHFGPLDVLINNAGAGGPYGPSWEADPEQWWRCQEVNLRGPFLCCHEAIPGMLARRRGRIINIASGAGARSIPYMSAYVVSKTALIRFSEVLAAETEQHGIRVFSVQPGAVRTAMAEGVLNDAEARRWLPWLPKIFEQGGDVPPEAAAQLAVFLASGKADALSGRMFAIEDDPAEVAAHAEQVRRDDLYTLRMARLR
jgi:NAD(P)-dependent dehydrogenase (short-subunit alcohol dehydrogenase family)